MNDGAPKTAYELAMERLRQKDKEQGIEERPVSDEQRAAVAEIRSLYASKIAEREILHRSKMSHLLHDRDARAVLEEEYLRDRDRLNGERDRKIEEARKG